MDAPPPDHAAASVRRGERSVPSPLSRSAEDVAKQQSGENFPVALRLLPKTARRHLQSIYGYARFVDDLGDEAPGDRLRLLDAVDADLDRLYAGTRPSLPVLAALAPTVRACALPAEPFRALVQANRVDQQVTRYQTWAELVGYCELSANPVGRLVLQVAGQATPDRIARSDDVCTALQVIEHLQDIGEDYRAGRIYLPLHDLAEYGVTEGDLGAPTASAALRRLIASEAGRAGKLLDSGGPLVASLRGWSRLAVAGYAGGGRAAVTGIAGVDFDTLRQAVHPARRDVIVETVRLVFARTTVKRGPA
jgi:squalene synthase HpnC